MSDALALAAGTARVELAPAAGGAIVRFTFGGADVLRPTPAAALAAGDVRGHACYPLIPYSNRIADARLAFGGRVHALCRNFGDHPHSLHGVGWQRRWNLVARETSAALLAVEHAAPAGDTSAWPWPFRATQAISLAADAEGATLTLKLTLTNTGGAPFPFGLGFHPFFPKTAASELGFSAAALWETDPTCLPTRRVPVADARCFDPAHALGGIVLDNVYAGWDGTATLRDPVHRLLVTMTADRAATFLVVFVPQDGDCLAVEPVTHMTDAFNRAVLGESGTGTRILGGGAAFSCTMRLFVRALP